MEYSRRPACRVWPSICEPHPLPNGRPQERLWDPLLRRHATEKGGVWAPVLGPSEATRVREWRQSQNGARLNPLPMTNLAARIRTERPLLKGRRGVAILLGVAMIASACLAPVAASAGDGGDGGGPGGNAPGAASGPAAPAGVGAATGPQGDGKGVDGAASGADSSSAEHASDAAAGEKRVVDEAGSALVNAGHSSAARPSRPNAVARRARAAAASPLAAPLRWLARNASRSLAHAASVADNASRAALGPPIAWLEARIHAATSDQDRAREAVKKGQIVPLASILKTVQKSVPGDVLKIGLSQDVVGGWNYSITVLTPQGYYRDVNVDAGRNQITQIKGH
jgi:uncharacterized membrane protein YkoI